MVPPRAPSVRIASSRGHARPPGLVNRRPAATAVFPTTSRERQLPVEKLGSVPLEHVEQQRARETDDVQVVALDPLDEPAAETLDPTWGTHGSPRAPSF